MSVYISNCLRTLFSRTRFLYFPRIILRENVYSYQGNTWTFVKTLESVWIIYYIRLGAIISNQFWFFFFFLMIITLLFLLQDKEANIYRNTWKYADNPCFNNYNYTKIILSKQRNATVFCTFLSGFNSNKTKYFLF